MIKDEKELCIFNYYYFVLLYLNLFGIESWLGFIFYNSVLESIYVRFSCGDGNKMATSVDALNEELGINGVEPLPEDFDATAVIIDPVPSAVVDNGVVSDNSQIVKGREKKIVLGRNIHTMCLEVTEPEADDEVTGDREAHMASVLARYKRALTERTKHHLGLTSSFDLIAFIYCIYVALYLGSQPNYLDHDTAFSFFTLGFYLIYKRCLAL